MKTYTNEQRYLALRKLGLWMQKDEEKLAVYESLCPITLAADTEEKIDAMADRICAAVEQIEPTVFSTGIISDGELLRKLIIRALRRKEKDFSDFSGGPDGVSEDDYDEVADEVVSAFTTKGGNNV